MKDENKTKEQLIDELALLRQRRPELETTESERKQAEEAARISEERLSGFMNSAEDSFYLLDSNLNFLDINKKGLKIIEKKKEEVIGKNITEVVPDVKESGRYEKHLEVLRTGKSFIIEHFVPHPIFGEKHFILKSFKVRDGLGVIATDITTQKQAEEELKSERDKLQALMDGIDRAGIGIDIVGSDYKVMFQSNTLKKKFGDLRNKICYENYMGQDEPCDFCPAIISIRNNKVERVELTGADGRNYQLFTAPLSNPDGTVNKAIEVVLDITERKKTEKEIQDYQKKLRLLASRLSLTEERERRNIATFLHDQISQKLALVKLKFGALTQSLLATEYLKPAKEIRDLIEETIQDTRTLTFELSPPILYELGLIQSIEWLVEQFGEKQDIQFYFRDDGKPKPLDHDIRTILFLSVRELLTNTIKHSKAKRVKVFTRRDGGKIYIAVEDDGIGFDLSKVKPYSVKTGGFGLFNIRERLEDFNGKMDIKPRKGHGTRVTLVAPLAVKRKLRRGGRDEH